MKTYLIVAVILLSGCDYDLWDSATLPEHIVKANELCLQNNSVDRMLKTSYKKFPKVTRYHMVLVCKNNATFNQFWEGDNGR